MMFGRKINAISKRTDITLEEKLQLIEGLFAKKLGWHKKLDMVLERVGAVVIIFAISFFTLFIVFKEALFMDEAGAVKYLQSKGFDKIQITGYNISGCDNGKGYLHRTSFFAINNDLKIRAEGTVCTPMKKDAGEPIIDYSSINSFKNLTIKNYKKEQ